jgi:hypothetical protein
MNRHFRKIDEFDDYFISKNGNVYSKKRNKYLKHNGKYVVLHKNNKKYVRSINSLIQKSFEKQKSKSEEFKKIPGFGNYSINCYGDVLSQRNTIKKTFINPYGYTCIFLSINGKLYNRLIHRLVYESWNGEIPDDMTVDHIDGDKKNNTLNNLQLLTRSENVLKFHENNKVIRVIEGFIKIEGFDNYYINNEGKVISFTHGEIPHDMVEQRGGFHFIKNGKRYRISLNYLLNRYFNLGKIQKSRKYLDLNEI